MHRRAGAHTLRPCRPAELQTMLGIVNAAAEAYRGVIPLNCWRDPYMSEEELSSEIAAQVEFLGCEIDGVLVGVMGVQRVLNVTLIRHAYVSPAHQSHGIGGALLAHLHGRASGPILIGTWAAATWAIRFYQRHGFELAPPASTAALLRTYWTVSSRQIETSVVLAWPPLTTASAAELIEAAGCERARLTPSTRP